MSSEEVADSHMLPRHTKSTLVFPALSAITADKRLSQVVVDAGGVCRAQRRARERVSTN